MKRVLLLLGILFVLAQSNAKVIFVKSGSNGNGASWEQAYGDLQQALKQARVGDEIWVAAGKYVPSRSNDRTASFFINDGVKLFGGFAGFERNRNERNWMINQSVLSGELGSPSNINDNAYTIIYTRGVSSATVVDGFTISGGAANGIGKDGDMHISGAAWYNDGAGKTSSPTIRNCTFRNNYARMGAGIYNFAYNSTCNPSIVNCKFIANRADLDGGAIYNDGNNGTCSPNVQDCYFEDNEAYYGAGILNRGAYGMSRPAITNCVFIANHSIVRGGGIYNHREDQGICEPIITACRFEQNKSMVGKAVSNTTNSNEISTDRNEQSGIIYKSSGY